MSNVIAQGIGIMLTRRQIAAGLLLAAALPRSALAQAFPTRPIKLILPYAAGGGTDAIARIVAQAMTERLGQAVVIENVSTRAQSRSILTS
jgi:tripartite-type tricarboxylate transporter receptor subunit TctC